MAKTQYNVNDVVYAIDTYHYDDKSPNSYKQDFHRIVKCIVVSIYINSDNSIEYNLKDIKENYEWGESIKEIEVFKHINDALAHFIKLCKL